jgi:hypothetical protein
MNYGGWILDQIDAASERGCIVDEKELCLKV